MNATMIGRWILISLATALPLFAQPATAPDARLWPQRRKIVYVLCVTSQKEEDLDFVRRELRKALDVLKPVDSYDVVWAQEKAPSTAGERKLLPATPDNKRATHAFIDKLQPVARPDLVPALAAALDHQADLIYLLVNTDQPDPQAVVRLAAERNQERRTTINSIALGRLAEAQVRALADAAEQSGGVTRVISDEERRLISRAQPASASAPSTTRTP